MLVDVSQPILGFDGKPMRDTPDGEPVLLRDLLSQVLNAFMQSETPTAEDKEMAFPIALRIHSSDKVRISSEEVSYIKRRSGVISSVLAHGRILEALDELPAESAPVDEDE